MMKIWDSSWWKEHENVVNQNIRSCKIRLNRTEWKRLSQFWVYGQILKTTFRVGRMNKEVERVAVIKPVTWVFEAKVPKRFKELLKPKRKYWENWHLYWSTQIASVLTFTISLLRSWVIVRRRIISPSEWMNFFFFNFLLIFTQHKTQKSFKVESHCVKLY